MGKVIQAVVFCIFLGCVFGAPTDKTGTQDVESFQRKMKVEKTFNVEGQTLTEILEQTDDGIIVGVEDQQGSIALTVFTDNTHELLIHRYNANNYCYISSLAEYNDARSEQENPSSLFKYRLEPISEINHQYFSNTATDLIKRACNGAENILWSKIKVDDKQETRQKRWNDQLWGQQFDDPWDNQFGGFDDPWRKTKNEPDYGGYAECEIYCRTRDCGFVCGLGINF